MAAAPAVIGMAGTAISGAGAAADSAAATGSRKYAAQVERQNMDMKSQQHSGREDQMRRQMRQALGAQAAAVAESGTGFGGTNRDVMEQDAATAMLDALNLRYEARLQRRDSQNKINSLTATGGGLDGIFGKDALGRLSPSLMLLDDRDKDER